MSNKKQKRCIDGHRYRRFDGLLFGRFDAMRYSVLKCDGKVEATMPTLREAIAKCIERERISGDGYARLVMLDGTIIADAEGIYPDPERYVDAATQTGMYD